jgi:beta-lactamase regulating signal transducer with metallopeptidase domain
MNNLIDAIVNNGTLLFVGVTLLLSFGCLAVAAHRSPVHRQRLAEFAIAATLIWLVLAVAPLPRPLARGYFFDLSQAISQRTPPAPAEPTSVDAVVTSSIPTSPMLVPTQPSPTFVTSATAPAPTSMGAPDASDSALPTSVELTQVLPLIEPAAFDGAVTEEIVFDAAPSSDSLTQNGTSTSPNPISVRIVPKDAAAEASTAANPPATLPARFVSFLQANWKYLLLGVYACGVAVCAGWILLGRVLLARIVRTSKPPEYWLNELFADLCEERGTTDVWLVLSERFPRALSFGIRRPTVVMPAALCVPENAEILRHVLRHELVHVGRRDAWGTLLFNVSFLFLFFHPAFWWLRSRARLSAELVADEWAATRSSRDEYARELIAFVRATRRATFLPAGATGVLGSTTPFTRRIEMLIRRERPLEMQSSPAWRIASCGVLGGLIIIMAASLGRTAQTDPETSNSETAAPPSTITVTVEDDDENPAVVKVDSDDDDKDEQARELHEVFSTSEEDLQRMQKQYEKLARKSAELQKQMAELQRAFKESTGAHVHKSAPGPHPHAHPHALILKDGEIKELESIPGLEVLKNLESLKGLEALKSLESLKDLDVMGLEGLKDGLKFKIEVLDDEDAASTPGEKKGSSEHKAQGQNAKALGLAIKAKKAEKGDKAADEETTIELKTDEGEMILEVGPDHILKVKRLKGFGKSPADLEGLKKTLEKLGTSLPQAVELSRRKILVDSETGRQEGSGKKLKKKDKGEKETRTESRQKEFKVELDERIQEQLRRAHTQAHRAQMEALRARIEAEQRILEKLKEKSEQLRKESSSSKDNTPSTSMPAQKLETQQRQVMVTTGSPATITGEHRRQLIEKEILRDSSREPAVARRDERAGGKPNVEDLDVVASTLVSGDQPKHLAKRHGDESPVAAAPIDSSTDLMRLAELVSNAVAELEQAKAAQEEAQVSGGSSDLHLAQTRLRSSQRKVQLLSRIAQSMNAVLAAKARRLHNLHEHSAVTVSEVEEIDAKLRIVDLILADVNSTPGKSATSATPATPVASVSAVSPVAAVTPVRPVASRAPSNPFAAVAPVDPASPAAAPPAAAPAKK